MEVVNRIYSLYKRDYNMCQSNGFFSINLTKKSVESIITLLDLRKSNTVCWVGFGDGRELFSIASLHPDVLFLGYEINSCDFEIANMILKNLEIPNVTIHNENALGCEQRFSHVYSTAIAGPELYNHLYNMTFYKLCMLESMWTSQENFEKQEKASVTLSGSNEKRQLISMCRTGKCNNYIYCSDPRIEVVDHPHLGKTVIAVDFIPKNEKFWFWGTVLPYFKETESEYMLSHNETMNIDPHNLCKLKYVNTPGKDEVQNLVPTGKSKVEGVLGGCEFKSCKSIPKGWQLCWRYAGEEWFQERGIKRLPISTNKLPALKRRKITKKFLCVQNKCGSRNI